MIDFLQWTESQSDFECGRAACNECDGPRYEWLARTVFVYQDKF